MQSLGTSFTLQQTTAALNNMSLQQQSIATQTSPMQRYVQTNMNMQNMFPLPPPQQQQQQQGATQKVCQVSQTTNVKESSSNSNSNSTELASTPQWTNVFFKNIPYKWSQDDLIELIMNDLKMESNKQSSVVTSVYMRTNPHGIPFACINFASHDLAAKIVDDLNGYVISDAQSNEKFVLYVVRAIRKKSLESGGDVNTFKKMYNAVLKQRESLQYKGTNLYITNLDAHVNKSHLVSEFGKFGVITSATVIVDKNQKSREFGFVCFEERDDAVKAIAAMNGKDFFGKRIHVTYAQDKRNKGRSDSSVRSDRSVPPPSPTYASSNASSVSHSPSASVSISAANTHNSNVSAASALWTPQYTAIPVPTLNLSNLPFSGLLNHNTCSNGSTASSVGNQSNGSASASASASMSGPPPMLSRPSMAVPPEPINLSLSSSSIGAGLPLPGNLTRNLSGSSTGATPLQMPLSMTMPLPLPLPLAMNVQAPAPAPPQAVAFPQSSLLSTPVNSFGRTSLSVNAHGGYMQQQQGGGHSPQGSVSMGQNVFGNLGNMNMSMPMTATPMLYPNYGYNYNYNVTPATATSVPLPMNLNMMGMNGGFNNAAASANVSLPPLANCNVTPFAGSNSSANMMSNSAQLSQLMYLLNHSATK